MNQKFKLIIFSSISGAIILTIHLIFQSEAVKDMSERSDRIAITLVQRPTSDWDALRLSDFARVVQLTKIDLTCIPPCLVGFEPIKTTMAEIFDWVKRIAGIDLIGSNGTLDSPRNAFGSDFGSLKIFVFSDDSQPTPKVRAMYYSILLTRNISAEISSVNTEQWLPENILQNQLPSKIFIATTNVIDRFGGVYAILLDFDTWAVGYGGRVVLSGEGLDFSICPHASERASIFVYSQEEENVVSLFRDLATYPNIKAYFNPLFSANDYQEISHPNQIAAISDQLRQAQCIDPKTLPRGE